jgi:hypothetical protein
MHSMHWIPSQSTPHDDTHEVHTQSATGVYFGRRKHEMGASCFRQGLQSESVKQVAACIWQEPSTHVWQLCMVAIPPVPEEVPPEDVPPVDDVPPADEDVPPLPPSEDVVPALPPPVPAAPAAAAPVSESSFVSPPQAANAAPKTNEDASTARKDRMTRESAISASARQTRRPGRPSLR